MLKEQVVEHADYHCVVDEEGDAKERSFTKRIEVIREGGDVDASRKQDDSAGYKVEST